MDELRPEDLEELVQEVSAEDGEEGSPTPEIEGLLEDLMPTRLDASRQRAANQLGEVSSSNREVVQVLIMTAETDSSAAVRAAATESLRAPVHQAVLQQSPRLVEAAAARTAAAQERDLQRTLVAERESGKRLSLGAERLGIVNAVLCGLLAVMIVIALLLCVIPIVPLMGEGSGILGWVMLVFFIPLASIPIGISCLVGVVRSRAAIRRHPSREARAGLRLSLGGAIAVILGYAIAWGILLL